MTINRRLIDGILRWRGLGLAVAALGLLCGAMNPNCTPNSVLDVFDEGAQRGDTSRADTTDGDASAEPAPSSAGGRAGTSATDSGASGAVDSLDALADAQQPLSAQQLREVLAEHEGRAVVVVFMNPLPGPPGPQGPPGPGVTSHNQLGGLLGDDHPQYVRHNEIASVTGPMLANDSVDGRVLAFVPPAKVVPQGAGSGLDADRLDGRDALDFQPIPGEVRMFAGPIANIPPGWHHCDGAALSRSVHAKLYAAIGTTYGGGDGSTTFNLPDFRNRGPMGASVDLGPASSTTVTGSPTRSGGAANHTLTVNELPPHNHDISHTHDYNRIDTMGGGTLFMSGSFGSATIGTTTAPLPQFSSNTGGGLPHNILDPYYAIVFMIYVGP